MFPDPVEKGEGLGRDLLSCARDTKHRDEVEIAPRPPHDCIHALIRRCSRDKEDRIDPIFLRDLHDLAGLFDRHVGHKNAINTGLVGFAVEPVDATGRSC